MKAKNLSAIVIAIVALAVVFVLSTCTFIVDERHQAVVTRLKKPVIIVTGDFSDEDFAAVTQDILTTAVRGEVGALDIDPKAIRIRRGPGLYFKLPFVDEAELFPDVLLEYDAEPREIILADKKKLMVDNFARWRIWNPLLYRVTVGNTRAARDRLDDIIYSSMREELGNSPLIEVIRTSNSSIDAPPEVEATVESATDKWQADDVMQETIERGREDLMKAVTAACDKGARKYGIRIIDVRIKRADLLRENLEAVFGRMQAERSRISKGYRSEGEKEASIIRGQTDREVQVILAEAERDALKYRGEGDAQAVRIIAEAFNSNPDFYRYMRSLQVIEEATPLGSEFIIGLDSSLYRLLDPKTDMNP